MLLVEFFRSLTYPCGSELARDSGGSACINVECADAIASRLAPTMGGVGIGIRLDTAPCGEGACSRWPAQQASALLQANRIVRFYGCCAAEREQAPSPQGAGVIVEWKRAPISRSQVKAKSQLALQLLAVGFPVISRYWRVVNSWRVTMKIERPCFSSRRMMAKLTVPAV